MSSQNKFATDRNQRILLDLLQQPGNDVCADCKARAPRWASWNIGIFICVQCAAVHRKIGTHVTKVKSVNMDAWSKEQVEVMKNVGNVKSNSILNPDEARNPPPVSMDETTRDSDLEKFIRAKYEYKRLMRKAAPPPSNRTPPRPTTSLLHPNDSPVPPPKDARYSRSSTPNPPRSTTLPATTSSAVEPPIRTSSQPYNNPQVPAAQPPAGQNSVWNDLVSLQGPTQDASAPVQYAAQPMQSMPSLSMPMQAPQQPMFTGIPQFSMGSNPSTSMQPSHPSQPFLTASPYSSPYSSPNPPFAPTPSFLSQPQFAHNGSPATPATSMSSGLMGAPMMSSPGSQFSMPSQFQTSLGLNSAPSQAPSYFQQQPMQQSFTPQLQSTQPMYNAQQPTGMGMNGAMGMNGPMGMGMNGMPGQPSQAYGSNNPFGSPPASQPAMQFQPTGVFQQSPLTSQPQQPGQANMYGNSMHMGWQPPQQAWGGSL